MFRSVHSLRRPTASDSLCPTARRLRLEPLEDRRMLAVGGYPELPGLRLIDPVPDQFVGQVIYLDFDGAEDVTYDGPVLVEGVDVPPFEAAGELAGQEHLAISAVLLHLEETFQGTGVVFTTDPPAEGVEHSTVYVGGDDSPFKEHGSFRGLAEKVDVGNQDRTDIAFAFTGSGAQAMPLPLVCSTISHEAAHLLGYAHVDASGADALIEDVAVVGDAIFGTMMETIDFVYQGGIEAAYLKGTKYLGFISGSVPLLDSVLDLGVSVYVDLADYYSSVHEAGSEDALSPEGAEDWITVWIDVNFGVGLRAPGLSIPGFNMGIVPVGMEEDEDPERQFAFEGLGVNFPFFELTAISYSSDTGKYEPTYVPRLATEILTVDIIKLKGNLLRGELKRDALDSLCDVAMGANPAVTPLVLNEIAASLFQRGTFLDVYLRPDVNMRAFTDSDSGPQDHTGYISSVRGGDDLDGDGIQDHYYPAFFDILGLPLGYAPAEVCFRNSGTIATDYFVKVSQIPPGWGVYGLDDGALFLLFDRKIDVKNVPGHAVEVEPEDYEEVITSWGIACTEDAVDHGTIAFELWHDVDGLGNTLLETVHVDVHKRPDTPVALDDVIELSQDSPLTFSYSELLANDVDLDGDAFWFEDLMSPAKGEAWDNGDGTITYVPPPGFVGTDHFDYWVTNGTVSSNAATVAVRIEESHRESYLVTATAGAGGSISPAGQVSVVEGGSIGYHATPNTNHSVDRWYVDGNEVTARRGYDNLLVSNVTGPVTVLATFKNDYVIDDNNDSWETASPLEIVEGTENWYDFAITAGDVDYYKFTLPAAAEDGHYVKIYLDGSGVGNQNLDIALGRYGGSGFGSARRNWSEVSSFFHDQTAGDNRTDQLSLDGFGPREYYLIVYGSSGLDSDEDVRDDDINFSGTETGGYSIEIRAPHPDPYEPDDDPSGASEIRTDGVAQHHALPSYDVDWTTFTLSQTSEVVVRAENNEQLNLSMTLYGPNSWTQTLDAASDNGGAAVLRREGSDYLSPGTYYVRTTSTDANDQRDYRIDLTATPIDLEPPHGLVLLSSAEEWDGDPTTLDSPLVRVAPFAFDDSGTVSQMRYRFEGENWQTWEAYSGSAFDVTVPQSVIDAVAGGSIAVSVQYRDPSGNVSSAYTDSLAISPVPLVVNATLDAIVDDGHTSLREVLTLASVHSGRQTITFAPSLYETSPATLTLSGSELVISSDVLIDGPGPDHLTLDANHASRVLFVEDDVTADVQGVTITGGSANGGGGIYVRGKLTVLDSVITANDASGIGGGIFCESGELTIDDCRVSENTSSERGGGLGGHYGVINVSNSRISDNHARYGGGIESLGASVTISGSTIVDNSARYRGGGIDMVETFSPQGGIYCYVEKSTLSSNSSSGSGGGLALTTHSDLAIITASIINTTISSNSAEWGGGFKLSLSSGGTIDLNVQNSTIVRNVADLNDDGNGVGGGIYEVGHASTTLSNSILADNWIGVNSPIPSDIVGPVSEFSSHNLISDATTSGGLTDDANGNIVGVTDLSWLLPLSDYGGPTWTHALLPYSPAVNAGSDALAVDFEGNPLTTDQRGESRTCGPTVDIGAYEHQYTPGDFGADGQVDQADLTTLLSNWGAVVRSAAWNAPWDGAVDQNELTDLLTNWGAGIGQTSTPNTPFQPMPGDQNRDGVFEFDDVFAAFAEGGRKYGTGDPATWSEGDFDRDGDFDFDDMFFAFSESGERYGSGPHVQSPTEDQTPTAALPSLEELAWFYVVERTPKKQISMTSAEQVTAVDELLATWP